MEVRSNTTERTFTQEDEVTRNRNEDSGSFRPVANSLEEDDDLDDEDLDDEDLDDEVDDTIETADVAAVPDLDDADLDADDLDDDLPLDDEDDEEDDDL